MESLPESSEPFEDAIKQDSEPQSVEICISESSKLGIETIDIEPIDLRDRFTWSNLGIVFSIPAIAGLIGLGLIYIYNPLAISWLKTSTTPVFYSNSLWNLPKNIAQIEAELGKSQLKLGENYPLKTGEVIYTVLEKETQNIREIRLYQTITDQKEEKLLLVSTIPIIGIDEYFVRSPLLKYITYEVPERLQPNRNRLPLKKLTLIDNPADRPNGIWLTTSNKVDGIAYGQLYYFANDKQSRLIEMDSWTSPAGEFPKWRNVLSNDLNSTQLVINQSNFFEPSFLIFQPEEVSNDSLVKLQLREVTLNEAKGQPKSYQDALLMASVGLWSPALGKFNLMIDQLKTQGKTLPPFLQEQYDLIALHSKITSEQAQNPSSNLGEKALVQIIDGRWTEALAIANDPAYKGDKIAEMLTKYHPHIWQRAMTMLTYSGAKEIKIWAGLVVLHREGLRRAEQWLRSQNVEAKDFNQLLQRMDLAPIALKPKQLLGTIAYIGKGNAGNDWFIPVSKLEAGQVWYEVSIDLIKDGNKWINAPFPELSDRSSILLWRILGFSENNNLGIVLTDAYGKSQTTTLIARSLWVGDGGSLKILASGEAALAPMINKSTIPPLVTSGGLFDPPDSRSVDWQTLAPKTIEQIIRTMYRELQRNGQVSLSIEEFGILVQQQWTLSELNLDGVGKSEYLLLINREQVDLGDRHYPLAITFASDGSLIFSDMSGGRIWIDVLPSSISGQILTLRGGRYEMWNFR
jgi:hypothetical protein